MNKPIALLSLVTSLLLSSPLTFAGEWMSAGNAPIPPYYTTRPVDFKCQVTLITQAGGKQYRVIRDIPIAKEKFQLPGGGVAVHIIRGEADPGMDGQILSLRFAPNATGGENIMLGLRAVITTRSGSEISSGSEREVSRDSANIGAEAQVALSPARAPQRPQSVRIQAVCSPN